MRQSIEEATLTHQSSTESVNSTKANGHRSSQSCKSLNSRTNDADSYSFRLSPPAVATKSPAGKKLVKSATSSALLSTRHLQRNESISSVSSDASNDMTLDELEIIKTIGTGTFGRVVLVYDQARSEYGALKILQLHDVIRLKQVDHVKNEKNILRAVKHPFIVNMKWNYKDECNIYMLFEVCGSLQNGILQVQVFRYVCGGELFSYLRRAGKFSSTTSAFYGAEIVCALEYLHGKSIVYRDLKPENLLLDKEGHLKITDFGFAKMLKDRTWTLCGTPEYLAPEIIQSKGHNKAVDWWALGVLIYEMNCGYAPFYDDNNFSTYEKILAAKLEWPKYIDPVAKDMIKKLLVPDRFKRLGNMKNGADDVKRHRWFRDYDWDDVCNRRLQPPIIPKVSFEGDTRNFDEYPEEESWRTNNSGINDTEMKLFADF